VIGGQALSTLSHFDEPNGGARGAGDSSDEEGDTFGGGLFEKEKRAKREAKAKKAAEEAAAANANDDNDERTSKEVFHDVMMKSKYHRMVAGEEKQEQGVLAEELDAKFDSLRGLLEFKKDDRQTSKNNKNKSSKSLLTTTGDKEADDLLASIRAKVAIEDGATSVDRDATPNDDNDAKFDEFAAEAKALAMEVKARASERLRTPEEIAREQRARLDELETQRLARMKGELPDAKKEKEKAKKALASMVGGKGVVPRSDDDLASNFMIEDRFRVNDGDSDDDHNDDNDEAADNRRKLVTPKVTKGDDDDDSDNDAPSSDDDDNNEEDEESKEAKKAEDAEERRAKLAAIAASQPKAVESRTKNGVTVNITADGFKTFDFGGGKSNVSGTTKNEARARELDDATKDGNTSATSDEVAHDNDEPIISAAELERRKKQKELEDSVPYTFEAPSKYSDFRKLLTGRSLLQQSLVIHRIMVLVASVVCCSSERGRVL
jgi:nucleolar protein 14